MSVIFERLLVRIWAMIMDLLTLKLPGPYVGMGGSLTVTVA